MYLYIFVRINPFDLRVDRMVGLNTLGHSCEFDYQQRVLKIFPGLGYLHSDDGIV